MRAPTSRIDEPLSDPYADLEPMTRRSLFGEARTVFEPLRSAIALPRLLQRVPKGNGEAVVVFPGYGTNDAATALLRGYLSNRGYACSGWGLGLNGGDVEALLEPATASVQRHLAARADRSKAVLIGWSLGGVIAREIARDSPELVQQVITFGTPVVGGPKYTVSAAAYRERGVDLDVLEAQIAERNTIPIQAPISAIFSKSDGVVNWRSAIDYFSPDVDHIELDAAHAGLVINPDVWEITAQTIACYPERWTEERGGPERFVKPHPFPTESL